MAESRTVWQIGGGPTSRSYVELFLRHGVGLIGPGDAGPWNPSRDNSEYDGSPVRQFAVELQRGDLLLLRSSSARVAAVGIVASEYEYLPQFDDVNGWPLQHGRRVRWYRLPEEHDFGRPIFGANPRRLSRVAATEVIEYAERFVGSPPTHWQSAPLPELPAEEEPLEEVPQRLADLVGLAHDLGCQLYWDREHFGEHPTEDEIVGHLVIPFFRALGWPPERIGIKWHYIDVALFTDLPRTPENCRFVVEAKSLGSGVEGALEQAKGYVESLGVPRDIVVTDGLRYRLYDCRNDFTPVAYANLGRLKKSALELFARLERP